MSMPTGRALSPDSGGCADRAKHSMSNRLNHPYEARRPRSLDAKLSAQSDQRRLQFCELDDSEVEDPGCSNRAVVLLKSILRDDQAELARPDLVGVRAGSMSRADARCYCSLDVQLNVSQNVLWFRHRASPSFWLSAHCT